jgi:hypothetical protein
VSGVRIVGVDRKDSINFLGVLGAEQISNYKKIPNYKHQITSTKFQIPILNDQNTGIENKSY